MATTRTTRKRTESAQGKRTTRTRSKRKSNGAASRSRVSQPKQGHFVKRAASSVGSKVGKMDLEKAMVLLHTALAIALVIKQQKKNRGASPRKGDKFRSAMSVLNYYLNGSGELSEMQRATLEDIKDELRMLYAREEEMSHAS
jgi:hypothetical protein